jgi:hypothetical protein
VLADSDSDSDTGTTKPATLTLKDMLVQSSSSSEPSEEASGYESSGKSSSDENTSTADTMEKQARSLLNEMQGMIDNKPAAATVAKRRKGKK